MNPHVAGPELHSGYGRQFHRMALTPALTYLLKSLGSGLCIPVGNTLQLRRFDAPCFAGTFICTV